MIDKNENIKNKLALLPDTPGVYQYFDKTGKIIYVGKAKNLKRRVSSYFNKVHDSPKTNILVKNIYDNQLYTGGNYDVTFNGLILDLSKAYLNEKTNITISTLFGGVDLYLPDDVNIQIQSSNFLGGVDLHKRENKIENTKVIYLNARCIFGGINIK